MEVKEKRTRLLCPIYDFKDGLIYTKLPTPLMVKEGKRKIKVDRIISRSFCDKILETMYQCMKYTRIDEKRNVEYICTTDHEIGMFNSWLNRGQIDEDYNSITNNPCVFTQALKDEIIRLWKEKRQSRKTKK